MADPLSDLSSIANYTNQGKDGLTVLNTAIDRGNDLSTDNQIIQDRQTLSPVEFLGKYGPQVSSLMDQVDLQKAQTREIGRDKNITSESLGDSTMEVGKGINNTLLSIAAYGARLVSPDLASAVSNLGSDYNKWSNSKLTPSLQDAMKLDAIKADLDKQDNNNQFAKDIANGDDNLTANLKKVGRDAMNAAGRLIEDPRMAGDLIHNAAGSLVAGAVTGSGLAALGTKVLGATVSAEQGITAAVPLMEGGGAYTQAHQEVLDTSFDDLAKNSKDYRGYIESGMSPENARKLLAQKASDIALTVQTPIAAATGPIVAKFEANPLKATPLREAAQNILGETVEEGIQNTGSQLGTNIAIANTSDNNQSLFEDLGSQAVQGTVGGGLSAATTAIPGAVIHTGTEATKGVIDQAIKAYDNTKLANENKVKAASPVSNETVEANVNTAAASTPNVEAAVNNLAKAANQNNAQTDDFVTKLKNAVTITPEDTDTLPQIVKDNLKPAASKFGLLNQVAKVAADKNASVEDRRAAGLYIMNQSMKNDAIFSAIPEWLSTSDHNTEDYQTIEKYQNVIKSISSSEAVQEAIGYAINTKQDDLDTNLNNTVETARLTPQNVNPSVVDQILQQADNGTITLTDEQSRAIRAAAALVNINSTYNEAVGNKNTDNTLIVNQQIEKNGGNGTKRSLAEHVKLITQAFVNKDEQGLKDRMREFAMFAKSRQYKNEAMIRAIKNNDGKPVTYKKLGDNWQWVSSEDRYGTVYYKPGSTTFARQLNAETKSIANLYDQMRSLYPEFKLPELNIADLPSDIGAKAPSSEDAAPKTENVEKTAPEVAPVEPSAPVEVESSTPVEKAPTEVPKAQEETTPISQAEPEAVTATEAEPKVEEVKAEEVKPVETKEDNIKLNLQNTYSELIGKDNLFRKAYNFTKNLTSRLVNMADPIQDLLALVEGSDAWTDALQSAVELKEDINSRLQTFLNSVQDKKTGKTFYENLIEGNESALSYRRGRSLSIVEQSGSDYRYNDNLIGSAIVAGLDWLANSVSSAGSDDRSDIAKALKIKESAVTGDLVNFWNDGISSTTAIKELAANIQKFWGITTNKDTDTTITKGILLSVAAEVLEVLVNKGIIVKSEFVVKDGTKTKTLIQLKPEFDAIKDIKDQASLISELALTEKTDTRFIGEKPTEVAEYQLRNPFVKTTKVQKDALKHAQSIPHNLNQDYAEFMVALGEDGFVELFGGDLDTEHINDQHKISVEGKNRSLRNSYNNVLSYASEMLNKATEQGIDIKDLPAYFEWAITKVGRPQMLGLNNPQSDKLAREIIMPTRVDVNLNDPEAVKRVWMTIGQGLGLKTEIKTRNTIVSESKDLTSGNGKFSSLVQKLEDYLETNDEKLPASIAKDLKALVDTPTNHMLHSLLTVAKMNRAIRNGNTNFETFNYLEADGKTNGPINTIALLSVGEFSEAELVAKAKGGYFIGVDGPQTLNNHYLSDSADLYKTAANRLEAIQNEFAAGLTGLAAEQYRDFLTVFNELNMNVSIVGDGDLKIERGVTKNPLTITVYGSGVDGIAGKVTSELVDEIYARMTQIIRGENSFSIEFYNSLENLMGFVPTVKDGNIVFSENKTNPGIRTEGQKYALSKGDFDALKKNVRFFFVNNMVEAINQEVMQFVGPSTTTIREATNAQSIVLQTLYNAKIIEALKAKGAKQGEFLSENELTAIQNSLLEFAPYLQIGDQEYYLSGSESTDLPHVEGEVSAPESFGASLTDSFRTPAYAYVPSLAGVSGIPTTVIGSGDGQMMLNALGKMNVIGLPVFDGFNMDANSIDTTGQKMNEAVHQTWQVNPLQAISDNFSKFMHSEPIREILKSELFRIEFIKNMSENYNGIGTDELLTIDEISKLLENTRDNLKNMAEEINLRQQVTNEFNVSVDQMASAEAPFFKEGTVSTVGLSRADIVALMNNRLAELKNQPNFVLVDEVKTEFPEATVISTEEIPNMLEGTKLTKTQKELLKNTLKVLKDAGYRVVVGTPSQLTNWEANHSPETLDGKEYQGKIDPINKIIYIGNKSAETVVHELIHAATIDKTVAYYNNGDLSLVDKEAFQRIEGLMNEFLSSPIVEGSDELIDANRQAQSAINGHLNAGRKAAALNEFMAWVLANKELAFFTNNTKVKNNIFKVVGNALIQIWKAVWGTKFAPNAGESIFSNLRFNTRVILNSQNRVEGLAADLNTVALHMSSSFGSNQRLAELRSKFFGKVMTAVRSSKDVIQARADAKNKAAEASNIVNNFIAGGWKFTAQEASTFGIIQAAIETGIELNTNSLSRIQDYYEHVISKIKIEDFMADPKSTNPNDRYLAQGMYDSLQGIGQSRQGLLSTFLAASMVSEQLRDILARMDVPKELGTGGTTLDERLTDLGMKSMDSLNRFVSGDKGTNVKIAMDNLVNNLVDNVGDQQTFIETNITNTVNGFDDYLANQIQNLSEKAHTKADVLSQNKNPIISKAAKVVKFTASLVNEQRAEVLVNGFVSTMNKTGFTTLREFMNEIIGRTKENASVFDMIGEVRSKVQQTRQQFREELPVLIKSKFKKEYSDKVWSDLFKSIGKTDLASLYAIHGLKGSLAFLTDKAKLAARISELEKGVPANVILKTKQLANYMVQGIAGKQLQRNAFAISKLNNFPNEEIIDELATLYALKNSPDVSAISTEETEGTEFLYSYLIGLRADELANINILSRYNHFKGHINSENQKGAAFFVADDREHNRLVSMGYTRVMAYAGSSADTNLNPMSYYFSPVSGLATYNQGVLQTVHQSVYGIDPRTGYSLGSTAGRITDPKQVRDVTRRLSSARQSLEDLMPIFDDKGRVIAYERALDPRVGARLNHPNEDIAEMTGAWRGRQVEENLAKHFNHILIDNLLNVWEEGKKNNRTDEYIALNKSKDAIHVDTWSRVPDDIKEYIANTFGENFMIRKDMLNDAVGFRSASVGDLWTGNSRWNQDFRKGLRDMLMTMPFIGPEGYKKLVLAEKYVQEAVSQARVLIVVKSIIVPTANLMSNVFQLLNRGVPARHVLKGMSSKTAELNDFINRRDKQVELEANLHVAKAKNDLIAIRTIENKLSTIKTSYKRMSIYPLIAVGHFNAISDGSITQEDLALANGKWSEFMEKIANKLPEALKTPARYAIIARDTALFKGLQRATQYGDFLGKAVLYDDLVNRKKMTPEDALAKVNEEFVDYNRLAGRVRNYGDNMGLIWFWNFKLRSIKTAISMAKENPLRSLMLNTFTPKFPIIGSIGTPLQDNFFSVLADGKLGYSIGPGMGINSLFLNPWVNIFR